MEKIININFQGRIIPIEEQVYGSLKQYIDSLRNHFANEEGSDEIISDIENRIAELFSDRIKRGANCITAVDLNAVIDSIGRLEDIEAADMDDTTPPKSKAAPRTHEPVLKERFFRNADEKVIAGVCSGIADRIGIDPVVVRIAFVLLFGALFWIYLLLWIIVPSKSRDANITRRLYRNPERKVIAGVCSGLAVYFRVDTWVVRLIFLLPLIFGLLSGSMHSYFWHAPWGVGPRIFTGSFGSTLFIIYIILWIAVPFASSATEKLEMQGQRIDMNSIKDATQANARATAQVQHRSGFGHVLAVLFKAFFLFIAGTMALSLFGVLIGLVFAGFIAMPFADFLLNGWNQYMLVLAGLVLFLGIPFLALITFLVRRLLQVRSRHHYLGYVFAGLWIIGLVSIITLIGTLVSNFSARSVVEANYPLAQPSTGKLYISVNGANGLAGKGLHSTWFETWDDEDGPPFHIITKDSLWLNTVKVNVVQSPDSLFHLYETRISRGNNAAEARTLATHIPFHISQADSVVNLPAGFAISSRDKFRNQQVMIVVEVPLGKKIEFNKNIQRYTWFDLHGNGRGSMHYSRDWDNEYDDNQDYEMTTSGLKSAPDNRPKSRIESEY